MPLLSASIDAFLITSIAIVAPWAYFALRSPSPPSNPPRRKLLTAVLLIHTLYIVYGLLVTRPQNIFRLLRVPVTMPSDVIQRRLLQEAGVTELPRSLESLLSRLSSFDVRMLYIRFGHSVVENCEHCRSLGDYGLHALPRPLLEYVREVALMGILTIRGSHRERWRSYAASAVISAGVAELYWLSTVHIKLPQKGEGVTMWHDVLWTARRTLFLLLPIALHYVPTPPPPTSPFVTISTTAGKLEQALARLQMWRVAHNASQRHPTLSAQTAEWWARERREGKWATEDEEVRSTAEILDVGIGQGNAVGGEEGEDTQGDGKLRANARGVVELIKRNLTQRNG